MRSPYGRAAGISVGRALHILPGIVNDDLRAAIAAIDRVHGDGELPTIPMMIVSEVTGDERNRDGAFVSRHAGEDESLIASAILIRRDAPHRSFVAVHEIGHFLDLCGLPGPEVSSRRHPDLERWREAVLESHTYHELEEFLRSPHAVTSDRAVDLLAIEELWARSYAQFVARRSGSLPLLGALNAVTRRHSDTLYFSRHWDEADFVGIETAIDELFRGMGWIA